MVALFAGSEASAQTRPPTPPHRPVRPRPQQRNTATTPPPQAPQDQPPRPLQAQPEVVPEPVEVPPATAPAPTDAGAPSGDGVVNGDSTDEAGEGAEGGERGGQRAPAEDAAESREQPLTDEQRARMVPSEGELADPSERAPHRFFFPPYLRETGPNHDTTVLFPLYFNSRVNDQRWLLIPPYYRLRSQRVASDAVFPLFYYSRGLTDDGGTYSTFVIPPVWHHQSRGPDAARSLAVGVFPLFSYYERFARDGRLTGEHLVIPGLLTFHAWWQGGQTTITPLFQYFRAGASRTWLAGPVVPLFAHHTSPESDWTWSLIFYRRMVHSTNTSLTVVGPFWTENSPTSTSINLAPVLFHSHNRTDSRTTLLPFFHTESSRDHFTLVTPLGGYTRTGSESTLVLPFYQNHRGATQLDAIAPLFFYSRNQRMGEYTVSVLNFVHNVRPTGYSWTFFPLIGRVHEEGRFDTTLTPLFAHSYDVGRRASTTWVFPSIHVERSPEHRVVNVYPLVYHAAGRQWHHNVVFPFVWDIGNREQGRQTTVIFPFYAHVGDRTGYTRWAFPDIVWWQHGEGETRSWGYDITPFFQYSEPRPGDYSWTIFYGLAGHRRQGNFSQTRVFWATIDSGRPNTAASNAPAAQAARASRDRAAQDVLLDL